MSEHTKAPTMRLRWEQFYRPDRGDGSETPAAAVPWWETNLDFRLQQWFQCSCGDDEHGEWRDIEVVRG